MGLHLIFFFWFLFLIIFYFVLIKNIFFFFSLFLSLLPPLRHPLISLELDSTGLGDIQQMLCFSPNSGMVPPATDTQPDNSSRKEQRRARVSQPVGHSGYLSAHPHPHTLLCTAQPTSTSMLTAYLHVPWKYTPP